MEIEWSEGRRDNPRTQPFDPPFPDTKTWDPKGIKRFKRGSRSSDDCKKPFFNRHFIAINTQTDPPRHITSHAAPQHDHLSH